VLRKTGNLNLDALVGRGLDASTARAAGMSTRRRKRKNSGRAEHVRMTRNSRRSLVQGNDLVCAPIAATDRRDRWI